MFSPLSRRLPTLTTGDVWTSTRHLLPGARTGCRLPPPPPPPPSQHVAKVSPGLLASRERVQTAPHIWARVVRPYTALNPQTNLFAGRQIQNLRASANLYKMGPRSHSGRLVRLSHSRRWDKVRTPARRGGEGEGGHEQLVAPCAQATLRLQLLPGSLLRDGACCRKRIDMHMWVCRCNRQGQDQVRG
jgi:hypothetical protein